MSGFRPPDLPRNQAILFPITLEEAVPQDHPVRSFDEILSSGPFMEAFEQMEEAYDLTDGKPPYHPKYLGRLWLFGMATRTRSSRMLESACHNRIDVRWLMECQTPDHSTICGFVKLHREKLKGLLKAVLRVGIDAGLVSVKHVAVDGSKVEANASNPSMKRLESLEEAEKTLQKEVDAALAEWKENEQKEAGDGRPKFTPANRKNKKKEMLAGLRQLKKTRDAIEAFKRRRKEAVEAGARQAPAPVSSTTDPDARQMMDKEGRSKPNYTTQIAVDPGSGIVVAEDVTDAPWDGGGLLPMVTATKELTGKTPEAVSADSAYNVGTTLEKLEESKIVAYMPDCGQSGLSSPERNESLEVARSGEMLSADQRTQILDPRTKRISREAFRYDVDADRYICPSGFTLTRQRASADVGVTATTTRTQYLSSSKDCARCSLRSICLSKRMTSRMVTRDQQEGARERLRARMATDAGRQEYKKRTVTERTYSWLKSVAGLRKFLRRGFDGVRAEFTLACTARNLSILVARMRKPKEVRSAW